jgi:hypothetical protein
VGISKDLGAEWRWIGGRSEDGGGGQGIEIQKRIKERGVMASFHPLGLFVTLPFSAIDLDIMPEAMHSHSHSHSHSLSTAPHETEPPDAGTKQRPAAWVA